MGTEEIFTGAAGTGARDNISKTFDSMGDTHLQFSFWGKYVSMYLCMYLCNYVCTFVRRYVCMYLCMYVYTYMYLCLYV